jgi:hypothetical protein
MHTRIDAIFSDYDGTLCPTRSVKNDANTVPKDLEWILWEISQRIPICVISSKDYHFLHPRNRFAQILSCIMGIETIRLGTHKKLAKEGHYGKNGCSDGARCIREQHLFSKKNQSVLPTLQANSVLLSDLAENIELEFDTKVTVERKFTADRRYLAGITVDYRHLEDWKSSKHRVEPRLERMVQKCKSLSSISPPASELYCMTYRSHPFMDVYALYCDKGIAFDLVAGYILGGKGIRERSTPQGVLYLGDSENDNPAFKKASVTLGIVSDERLSPRLDCEYLIEFKELSALLKHLLNNNFEFSKNLVTHAR